MRHEDDRQRAPAREAEDPAAPEVAPGHPLRRFPELSLLGELEDSCLGRYVDLLVERLGGRLEEVIVFGSVARGESWPRGMPIRSDLDLLVVVDSPLSEEIVTELVGATMPHFLECGRQIGPQFRTRAALGAPRNDRTAVWLADVERDGISIYRRPSSRGPIS